MWLLIETASYIRRIKSKKIRVDGVDNNAVMSTPVRVSNKETVNHNLQISITIRKKTMAVLSAYK